VSVKILDMIFQKETMTRSRCRMRQRSYMVADKTRTMVLTVWGEKVVEIGKWYKFQNVSVRLFNQRPCLSTTMQSVVSLIDDCGVCAQGAMEDREIIVGEIIDCDVRVEFLCPQNHTLQCVNHETLMTRCVLCMAYCKTSKVISVFRGHITIDAGSGNQKMHLEHDVFCKLLSLQTGVRYESDELASKILSQERLRVEMCQGMICRQ